MTYEEQLLTPQWADKRDEIRERDFQMCQQCMSTHKLEVHHKYYLVGKRAWEYPNSALITLCSKCHDEQHDGDPIPTRKHIDRIPELFGIIRRAVTALKNLGRNG